jgi:hypothetical protein
MTPIDTEHLYVTSERLDALRQAEVTAVGSTRPSGHGGAVG